MPRHFFHNLYSHFSIELEYLDTPIDYFEINKLNYLKNGSDMHWCLRVFKPTLNTSKQSIWPGYNIIMNCFMKSEISMSLL